MLRVVEILDTNDFCVRCKFNNDEIRRLDVLPIIENHKHLNGVEKLLEANIFATAQVGQCGEIVWPNIVYVHDTDGDRLWDYDISPEYAFHHSKQA